MRKILGIVLALVIPRFGDIATSQAGPTPFTIPSTTVRGILNADAGFVGNITVSGLLSYPKPGVFVADAGFFTDVQVTTSFLADAGGLEINGAYTGGCISDWSSSYNFLAIYPVACSATNNNNWLIASNSDESNVQLNLNGAVGSRYYFIQGGVQYASWNNSALNLLSGAVQANNGASSGFSNLYSFGTMIADAGSVAQMQIGPLGTVVTNVGVGSCLLASGTCNATISGGGVTGASLCSCQMINPGGSYYDMDAGGFTCMTTPDAGAVTVRVMAGGTTPFPAANIRVGIHCDN